MDLKIKIFIFLLLYFTTGILHVTTFTSEKRLLLLDILCWPFLKVLFFIDLHTSL